MDSVVLAEDDRRLPFSLGKKDPMPVGDHDDSAHQRLEFLSEEEFATLCRVSDTFPWTAYMIVVVELAERFSENSVLCDTSCRRSIITHSKGASSVFVNFIQQPLPPDSRIGAGWANGQSGALGGGEQMSTKLTTFYQFW
ncbi:hypothetical protein J3R82DRAFT_1535 [Butyriboletus roseoflavus]|nr:hypothetical protein J3R82DRAFT_1535 [Butyriboletus roseoflavus]